MIRIFNRLHYEDVLIVRVDDLVPEAIWQRRYYQINNFEKLLVETGTTVLKFYLHISREEQKERFEDRLKDPAKHWKFSRGDLEKRKKWNQYMAAYQDALSLCSTSWAPWYVIPADRKWYRNLIVAKTIVTTLEELHPAYPEADSLEDVVVD
jgi:polyphosphate kinase 2 (PPK2 family)